jgi:hypothetical protein
MTNLPVTGKFSITATYGQDGALWQNKHRGIDFVAANRDVYATCDGTVRVIAYDEGGWGRYISIGDMDGRRHLFCHLEEGSVRVTEGQKVNRTMVIAKMGDTGNVTGVHLHFQLNDSGNNPTDPSGYLGVPNKKGSYYSESFTIPEEDKVEKYNDDASIANWAKDAVQKVTDAGIMLGDENNNFNPRANLTRQEAAVIIERLLERWG